MLPGFPPAAAPLQPPPLPLKVQLYRYFFYGWLFRDVDTGSALERSAALRHNSEASRWLPTYMARWTVVGLVLLLLEAGAEHLTGDSPLSALLVLGMGFVVLYQLITCICWPSWARAGSAADIDVAVDVDSTRGMARGAGCA